MYKITTRTKHVIEDNISSLHVAIEKIKMLERRAKAAGIYSPGYYRIEKAETEA